MPTPEGPLKTELPPLPIEILKEKDVLNEFVMRVNILGECLLQPSTLPTLVDIYLNNPSVNISKPSTHKNIILQNKLTWSLTSHTSKLFDSI
jgi:hypothetical protein